MKSSGVHRQSHVYMIKVMWFDTQVHAMTSNKNGNHRISSKSKIKYMDIDKSESENMHRKWY